MNRKTATRFKRITAVLSSIFLASAAFAGTGLTANASATSITRISGSTRYETMAMVSQTAFPSAASKAAVVASGSSFPDALAASSLAGHLNAPILLTDPKTLSNATANELDRLDADTIYIIGGTNAVSNNAEKAIQASRPSATIRRLAGNTRFDTAFKSIANSPSSERSLRPPLFPLALTLPMRFPHHHIHTCNPRLSS